MNLQETLAEGKANLTKKLHNHYNTKVASITKSVATVNPFYSRMTSYVQFYDQFEQQQGISVTNHMVIELSHLVHCTNCFTAQDMHGAPEEAERSAVRSTNTPVPQSSTAEKEKLGMAQGGSDHVSGQGKWSTPSGNNRSTGREWLIRTRLIRSST